MGPHNDALRGGETKSNTKIQGVARPANDSGSMKVMVTSKEEVKESQLTDYGCSSLKDNIAE